MAVRPYRVTPARIGNSSGLRLPAAFYRDHPQFAGAAGQVEVLDDSTLLLRLEPEEQQQGEAEEDSLMLGLFLDFLRDCRIATACSSAPLKRRTGAPRSQCLQALLRLVQGTPSPFLQDPKGPTEIPKPHQCSRSALLGRPSRSAESPQQPLRMMVFVTV
jgi:hypothetical protein